MDRVTVRSELRAAVWTVEASVGDRVEAGAELLILESMKTEIPVVAPRAGTVAEVLVAEGDQVQERQALVVLAP